MNDFFNPGLSGALEKDPCIFDCLVKGHAIVLKAYPIGVVKRIDAVKRLDKLVRMIEVIGKCIDLGTERVRFVDVGGNGLNLPPLFEQVSGDIATYVSKSASYNI